MVWGEVWARVAIDVRGRERSRVVWTPQGVDDVSTVSDECCVLDRNGEGT